MHLVNVTSFAMRYRHISFTRTPSAAAIVLPARGDGCTITEEIAAELRDCCQALMLEDELRVVTISGSGHSFAVGRMKPPVDILSRPTVTKRRAWQDALGVASAVAALPMPVVAVLNGDAIAHGLELALAADLRVAVGTARLGAGDPMVDGFPFDGATQRLPRLVGPALARDMLFTGRALSALEALEFGLVNRVAPPERLDDVVDDLVSTIVASAPIAARYAKEAVVAAGELTLTQGLRLEADLSVILQSTDDRAEGLGAFAEKRSPQFQGH